MQQLHINKNTPFNDSLNCYKFSNVHNYRYIHCQPCFDILMNTNDQNNDRNKSYYLIVDCPHVEAFCHLVYEYFIQIKLIKKILQNYPDIILVLGNRKKQVINLFKLFNINNKIIYSIENYSNECFFLPLIALNDKFMNKTMFYNLIKDFIDEVDKTVFLDKTPVLS